MSTDDGIAEAATLALIDTDKNDCVKWCNANNHAYFSIATKGGNFQTYFYANGVVTAVFSPQRLMILDAVSARAAEM